MHQEPRRTRQALGGKILRIIFTTNIPYTGSRASATWLSTPVTTSAHVNDHDSGNIPVCQARISENLLIIRIGYSSLVPEPGCVAIRFPIPKTDRENQNSRHPSISGGGFSLSVNADCTWGCDKRFKCKECLSKKKKIANVTLTRANKHK